jgi:DNA-binding CsgD family transcriptional regulator/transcriptional regulator with XRE-family HTH domain/tetratricopeptide (TPR) repeat protein
VNDKLTHARQLLDLSQQDLADALRRLAVAGGEQEPRLSGNTISRWERGLRRPRARFVRLLCKFFGLTPEKLGLAEATEPMAGPGPTDLKAPVGRRLELLRLCGYLALGEPDAGQAILIEGRAGIGKTFLCERLGQLARSAGHVVLTATCSEQGLSQPFGPFVAAIEDHVRSTGAAVVARALDTRCRAIRHLFPRLRLGSTLDPAVAEAPYHLHYAMVDLLRKIAAGRGMLLVIEDLHWSDLSTQGLFGHLARTAPSHEIKLVGTYRLGDMPEPRPLWSWEKVASPIYLKPLDRLQVADLVRERFEIELNDAQHRDLYDCSEGIPYAIVELITAALDGQEHTAPKLLRLSNTMKDAIHRKVERLSTTDVRVLHAASALGDAFDVATLTAIMDSEQGPVRAALRGCVEAQLIEGIPRAQGRYRFRHSLTRQAVYETVPKRCAQALHRRAAEILTRNLGSSFEIGQHYLWSGDHEAARKSWHQAAREASEAGAHGVAAGLYQKLLDHVHDPLQRAQVQCEVGTEWLMDGEARRAVEPLELGIRTLWPHDSVLTARHRLTLARALCALTRVEDALIECQAALEILERQEPTVELARAFLRLADAFTDAGRPHPMLADRAMEIGLRLGDDATDIVLRARTAKAPERLYGKDVLGGLWELDKVVNEATAIGRLDIVELATFLSVIGHAHLDPTAAKARIDRARMALGEDSVSAMLAAAEGHYHTIVGDFRRALRLFDMALLEFHEMRRVAWTRWLESRIALVHARLGRLDDARRWTSHAGDPRWHRAITNALLGLDLDELDRGQEVVDLMLAGERIPLVLHAMAADLAVKVLIEQGRVEEARRVVAGLPPVHPEVSDGHFRLMMRARLASAESDSTTAVSLLRAGSQELERVGWAEYSSDVRLLLSDILAQLGAREAATAELREVLGTARQRGAELIKTRVGRRVREQVPLTDREREVARLIAESMTDPEIGRRLHLSPRTVESHSASIRSKLGGVDRTLVAAWVKAGRETMRPFVASSPGPTKPP